MTNSLRKNVLDMRVDLGVPCIPSSSSPSYRHRLTEAMILYLLGKAYHCFYLKKLIEEEKNSCYSIQHFPMPSMSSYHPQLY